MDAQGWSTETLLTATHNTLRRSKVDGRPVTLTDVENVWENLGVFLQQALKEGRATQLVKFGTFAPNNTMHKSRPENSWSLYLASDFVAGCGIRQRKAGATKVHGAARLNFLGLAKFSHLPKDLCRKVVETIIWTITFALTKDKSWMRLEFPGLGLFQCQHGICDFLFGRDGTLSENRDIRNEDLAFSEDGDADMYYNNATNSEDEERDEEDMRGTHLQPQSQLRDHIGIKTQNRSGQMPEHQEQARLQPRASQQAAPVRRIVIPPSMDRLREKVTQRGGANGIHSLSRLLRIMDNSGDRCLDREELKYGLQDYGIRINNSELEELFMFLDRDRNGKISIDEFLIGMRGPLSKRRIELIHIAFKRLDRTGDGFVTIEDLELAYDSSHDPDVKAGRTKPADALRNLLAQFDTQDKDGIVTREEFEDYYKNVSASIDNDDYFELMMRNAWHISGGQGQYANTSNRRVLVTHEDGSQTIEEIQDDLWVDKNDQDEMKRRLAQRGVKASGQLGLYNATDSTESARTAHRPKRFSEIQGGKAMPQGLQQPRKAVAIASKTKGVQFRQHMQDEGDEALPVEPVQNIDKSGDLAPTSSAATSSKTATSEDPMQKLGKILQQRRLSVDDFLLRIGANRVVGSASIDVPGFIRGLSRFDPSLSAEEVQAIAKAADADRSGSIDVAELCAYLQGSNAVERIKSAVLQRGGMNGIISLTRILRNMDTSRDGALDRRELTDGFAALDVKLNSKDVQDIFAFFDKDRSGKISFDEFLIGFRGELNSRRRDLVLIAFSRMDRTGDGVITVDDLELSYDPSHHPEFMSGAMTKTQVLREFLDSFDGLEKDGIVTQEEFLDYYKGLSASIDDDNYFELMMRNAWHISGGQGQYENTTNRRVLVTDASGEQSVKEVKDDLYFDASDADNLHKRLGLNKESSTSNYFASDATGKARDTSKRPARFQQKVNDAPQTNMRTRTNASQKSTFAKFGPSRAKSQLAWGRPSSVDQGQDSFMMNGGDESLPGGPAPSTKQTSRLGRFSSKVRTTPGSAQRRSSSIQSQNIPRRSQQATEPHALGMLRERVIKRGGTNGIHTLGRVLRIMDDSGDKSLDREELKYGLEDYGIKCTPAECDALFTYLDRDGSGKISFDEFLAGMRGPVPERRVTLIKMAFQRLDRAGDGQVTVEDLEMIYDPSFHPEVRSGNLTKAQALREFLSQFDTIDKDGIVTEEEFIEYYKNVSASIDSDDYFELMMRNAWHISGGQGQMANTTNRRVLVTHEDGRQSIEEVQDDLWVDKDDEAEMKRRLAKRGVKAQGSLGMFHASDDTHAPKNIGKRPQLSHRGPRQPQSQHKHRETTISLAWDEPEDLNASQAKIRMARERERKIRAGAATRVQAAVIAHRAKRKTEMLKRNQQTKQAQEQEVQQERQAQARRIIRPAGPNWY